MTGRTGWTDRIGQAKHDSQNRTVKTGQTNQAGETGQVEYNRQTGQTDRPGRK